MNPAPNAVTVSLHQLAMAQGADYVDALVAAHQTSLELEAVSFDTTTLVARLGHRVRATPITNHLLTAMKGTR